MVAMRSILFVRKVTGSHAGDTFDWDADEFLSHLAKMKAEDGEAYR